MLKLLALRDAYLRNQDGATAIEYGLIAAGIALAILVAVNQFGTDLSNLFGDASDALTGEGGE
jgi:pilus assembly protein Flp/PilA